MTMILMRSLMMDISTDDDPGSVWRALPARGGGRRLECQRLHRVKTTLTIDYIVLTVLISR